LAVNSAKVVHETIDEEVVIINLDTGVYYSLTDSGLEVWRGIEAGVSRETLIEALASGYGVEREVVAEPTGELLDQLLQEGVIVTERSDSEEAASFEVAPQGDRPDFSPPALSIHSNMTDLLLLDPIHDVDEEGWPKSRPE
jgi:hypothetical protein